MPDQFSLFRDTTQRLTEWPGWGRVPLVERANLLRVTWKRHYMRWRPASHWEDFVAWSTEDWARVIRRLSR